MRVFFVWFLLAWLFGLALGAAGAPFEAGLAMGAGVGAFLLVRKWPAPYAATVMALVCLGYLRVPVQVSEEKVCSFSSPLRAIVAEPALIEADRIQVIAERQDGCRALIYADRFSDVGEGDEVLVTGGSIKSLDDAREFSEGYADYLARRGIGATILYPHIAATWRGSQIPPLSRGALRRALGSESLHEYVRDRVNKIFNEPEASLVMAMLFAERGTLPEDIVRRFRGTGVSHVLAISGLHISLLAGMMLALLLTLPLSPWARTIILLVLLWTYVSFIGAPTSAIRAASFWTIALIALRLHLLVSLPAVILLAAGVLVSMAPEYIKDVGFQLSLSAVAGIWLVLFLIPPDGFAKTPSSFPLSGGASRTTLVRKVFDRLVGYSGFVFGMRWLLSVFLVSLGASLATAPLIAYHFGNIAWASVMTNLLVVPVVPALLLLAILALLVSFVFMPAALLIAFIVHALFSWISFVTKVFADVPYLFWEEVAVPSWLLPGYYAALVLLAMLIIKRQGRSWREAWG